jgi:glycosyltransferase involved in cell wall biosynthesis
MGKIPRAIVSVTNDLYTDNRVNKVCLFLMQQGYEVLLIGRQKKDSLQLSERPYKTKRIVLLFEKGALFYAAFNIRLFLFLLFKRCDLLVSNDLDTLVANYTACKFKPGTRLVYDSHEYFTEVPELINRPRIKKIWEGIEGWIFPKLKTVYTVNDSIAKLYREKYKKEIFVVRNVSPKWNDSATLRKIELGIAENQFVVILQGAGINIDRGAEEAVEAMRTLPNVVLLIVGDGDVVPELKKYVETNHLVERVKFIGKKPYSEMMQYTALADVGLTLDKPSNLNYRFSLPNKVFDYLHATTPVICTDLPEVAGLIRKYDAGIVLSELTTDKLITDIQFLQNNPEELSRLKQNCILAATHECWEEEMKVLELIYPKVGRK